MIKYEEIRDPSHSNRSRPQPEVVTLNFYSNYDQQEGRVQLDSEKSSSNHSSAIEDSEYNSNTEEDPVKKGEIYK